MLVVLLFLPAEHGQSSYGGAASQDSTHLADVPLDLVQRIHAFSNGHLVSGVLLKVLVLEAHQLLSASLQKEVSSATDTVLELDRVVVVLGRKFVVFYDSLGAVESLLKVATHVDFGSVETSVV